MVKTVTKRKLLTIALNIAICVLDSYHLKKPYATFKQGVHIKNPRCRISICRIKLYQPRGKPHRFCACGKAQGYPIILVSRSKSIGSHIFFQRGHATLDIWVTIFQSLETLNKSRVVPIHESFLSQVIHLLILIFLWLVLSLFSVVVSWRVFSALRGVCLIDLLSSSLEHREE